MTASAAESESLKVPVPNFGPAFNQQDDSSKQSASEGFGDFGDFQETSLTSEKKEEDFGDFGDFE